MSISNTFLEKAILAIGNMQKIADACGVTHQAVCQWRGAGYLPRTELIGTTEYGKQIQALCQGKVTHRHLLAENRAYRIAKKQKQCMASVA